MLSLFNPLWKLIECYVYETSFRKQFPNTFFLGFLIWSAHGSRLRSHRGLIVAPRFGSHSGFVCLCSAGLNLRYVYAKYWFNSAQKACSRSRGSNPDSAIETSLLSQASRSSCVTSSALRQTGGSGHPKILCSGITRPSSRMKSLHRSPHLTSLRIPVCKPLKDLNVMTWSSSGGQFAPVPTCFAVGFICWHLAGLV